MLLPPGPAKLTSWWQHYRPHPERGLRGRDAPRDHGGWLHPRHTQVPAPLHPCTPAHLSVSGKVIHTVTGYRPGPAPSPPRPSSTCTATRRPPPTSCCAAAGPASASCWRTAAGTCGSSTSAATDTPGTTPWVVELRTKVIRPFQPGEGPSRRGLFPDCEIFACLRLKL